MLRRLTFLPIIYSGICCCLLSINAKGQTPLTSETFTVKEGLSENVVHSLFQDKKGFLWIGTHEGLNRYDGYEFKKYLHNKADSTSLPNSAVENISQDGQGNIVILANFRIGKMDRLTGQFTFKPRPTLHFPHTSIPLSSPSYPFRKFIEDDFWIYNEKNTNGNKFLITDQQFNFLKYPSSLAMFYDFQNRLWVLQRDRLIVIDGNGKSKEILKGFTLKHTASNTFLWFLDDPNGNIWLRAADKMFCIDKESYNVKLIVTQEQLKEMAMDNINTLLLDKSGILWVGSFYGLKKLNLSQQKFRHITEESEKGLVSNFVLGMNLHSGNKLAIQHYYLDSFYTEIELPSLSVTHHKIEVSKPEIFLREALIRNENGIYTTEWNRLINKISRENLQWNLFRYGYTDRNGSIWFFYEAGRLTNLSNGKFIPMHSAEYLWDDENFLWVATTKQGLLRYNKINGEIKEYLADINNPSGISSNELICLTPDKKGNLWIGTRGGGLNYFDKNDEKFFNYTQANGLSNNTIYCMVMDNDNNLWMGTSQGLSCFNTQTKTFQNFYTSDGLMNTEFNRWSAVKDAEGNLYFGGMHGIDYFKPQEVLLQQKTGFAIQLTDFKTGNRSQSLVENTQLSYKENYVSFQFAAMDFRNPEATQYKYMLEGANSDWIDNGNNHTATFAALPPGEYKFRVKGTIQNGVWSNEVVFFFTIKTPWWQTWWFYTLCGLCVAGVLYGVYRFRIDQLRKLYSVRNKISQDLHDEVGATLSSIHVYSSVASKAMNADPEKSQDALNQININTRQVMENMNDIVWAMHTGNKGEITFENKLKNYGYELLTPLNISCTYDINKEAEKLMTNIEARKNMLLISKEAINNIAKHSGASEASVLLKIAGRSIQLEIIDNGKGIENKRNGNGLQNMKSRTEALGGKFQFSSNGNEGTHINCIIPITNIRD